MLTSVKPTWPPEGLYKFPCQIFEAKHLWRNSVFLCFDAVHFHKLDYFLKLLSRREPFLLNSSQWTPPSVRWIKYLGAVGLPGCICTCAVQGGQTRLRCYLQRVMYQVCCLNSYCWAAIHFIWSLTRKLWGFLFLLPLYLANNDSGSVASWRFAGRQAACDSEALPQSSFICFLQTLILPEKIRTKNFDPGKHCPIVLVLSSP